MFDNCSRPRMHGIEIQHQELYCYAHDYWHLSSQSIWIRTIRHSIIEASISTLTQYRIVTKTKLL